MTSYQLPIKSNIFLFHSTATVLDPLTEMTLIPKSCDNSFRLFYINRPRWKRSAFRYHMREKDVSAWCRKHIIRRRRDWTDNETFEVLFNAYWVHFLAFLLQKKAVPMAQTFTLFLECNFLWRQKKSDVQSERCGLPGRRGIFPYCQASTDVFHFSRWRKEKKEGLLTEPCAQITHPTITPHNVQRQQKRRLERRSVEKAANVSNGTESKTREFSVEERLNGFYWEIARRSNFLQWHIRLILP